MVEPRIKVLLLLDRYTRIFRRFLPGFEGWIALSRPVCSYVFTEFELNYVFKMLSSLESEGYLESRNIDHDSPVICRWYRITDKYQSLY